MIAAAEREQSQLERRAERPRFRGACDLCVGARPAGAQPLHHGRCHTDSSVARTAAEAAQTSALRTKVGQQRPKYTQKHLEKKQLILITVRLKTATGRETHKFKISLIDILQSIIKSYIIDLNQREGKCFI